jgi:glycolate oxidase subunit GlcD
MTLFMDALKTYFKAHQLMLTPEIEYCKDYSQLPPISPLCVVFVESTEDVLYLVKLANEYAIPLITRGAGTGKAGGSIPDENGVVVSLERMDRIQNIDHINRTITVEPGVILSDLQQAISQEGLWYPVDPASAEWCTIGGNVACNAGGPRALKYGVTGDYVIGIKGVYGDGTFFQLGGKLRKDVAGYDLKRLLIGSEGTLAIITSITLRLLPPPPPEQVIWCGFDCISDGIDFLIAVLSQNLQPTAAEFMPRVCIKAVESYHKTQYPFSHYAAHLLLVLDASHELNFSTLPPCHRVQFEDQASLWKIRRDISESLTHVSLSKCSEDITVPVSQLPALMRGLQRLTDQTDYICLGYGHLGDGNVHVNVLNTDQPIEKWHIDQPYIVERIIKLGISLGGTLSGEHGIGLTKKPFMPLYFSERDIAIMKGIKAQFDPNHILNPSKVFD